VNRWTAARDGLQATLHWRGSTRPVVDLLSEMLDACAHVLEKYEARRGDFPIIGTMLEKRLCQADFVMALAVRYPEPYALTSAYAKMVRHWDAFDRYLAKAPALEPLPSPDEAEILAEHLRAIGEGTPYYRTREVMAFPPPDADAMLEEMIRQGLVKREMTPERGITLTRTQA